MGEREIIENTKGGPITVSSLTADLRKLGLEAGMTVLVHSSLSGLGWVCGGPAAVILTLQAVLTEEGTLVMPAHSSGLSDPAHWEDPPVPASWWETIRREMPAFESDLSVTRGMGVIAETFRKGAGVLRSSHPTASFAAWGKHKERVVQDRHFDYSQNERSPLGRVYELDGWVLLLGVDYSKNTSFHLAEYKAAYPGKAIVHDGFPVVEDDVRKWRECEDILYRAEDFPELGAAFEESGEVRRGLVGQADVRLMRQRPLVDFAVRWMERNRT